MKKQRGELINSPTQSVVEAMLFMAWIKFLESSIYKNCLDQLPSDKVQQIYLRFSSLRDLGDELSKTKQKFFKLEQEHNEFVLRSRRDWDDFQKRFMRHYRDKVAVRKLLREMGIKISRKSRLHRLLKVS